MNLSIICIYKHKRNKHNNKTKFFAMASPRNCLKYEQQKIYIE